MRNSFCKKMRRSKNIEEGGEVLPGFEEEEEEEDEMSAYSSDVENEKERFREKEVMPEGDEEEEGEETGNEQEEEEEENEEEEEEEGGSGAMAWHKIKLNDEISKEEKAEEERQRKLENKMKSEKALSKKKLLYMKELEKSAEVKEQKRLWKNLVGIRIHMEKCLNKINCFLHPDTLAAFPSFSSIEEKKEENDANEASEKEKGEEGTYELQKAWKKARKDVSKFLSRLLFLHSQLNQNSVKNNSINAVEETDNISTAEEEEEDSEENSRKSRKRRWDERSTPEEKKMWGKMNVWTEEVKRKCLSVADEWKTKTQLELYKGFKVLDTCPSAQLRNSLRDFTKLLSRTRNEHVASKIIGASLHEKLYEKDAENSLQNNLVSQTYCDQDLYVDLLKSLVEEKFDGSSEGILDCNSEDSLLKGGLRKSKKKVVDRRASKGRKIRYVQIPQLANFMSATVPEQIQVVEGVPGIHDEKFVSRLMSSLFAAH